MADYYQTLGLPRTATGTQIRAAYKRLAMQYHPDRNPGNLMAEEMFKQINEAYHVLADPVKKSRYDSRFTSYQTTYTTAQQTETYWRDVKRRQHYRANVNPQPKTYTITGNYFKIQGLAFLVFLVLSGISFGIVHTASFFFNLKYENIRKENRVLVEEVNALFGTGKIDEAISRISTLHKQKPSELQFTLAHDSLLNEIRQTADKAYTERNYPVALTYLQHLHKYETYGRFEILKKIAACQYNLTSYADALQSVKQLHSQQPWNIEFIYQIGTLNLYYLDNVEEAHEYFALGEKVFRDNLTRIYGEAYMLMLDPKNTPEIYYQIFLAQADIHSRTRDFTRADKAFDMALYLRPEQAEGYVQRATMNIGRKQYKKACTDLAKAVQSGSADALNLQQKYCR